MMNKTLRALLVVPALLVAAACENPTDPGTVDDAALQADLAVAAAAVSAPATVSLGALGDDISIALGSLGGGIAVLDLPAALLSDPGALAARAELRQRVESDLGNAAVIPAAALGRTFEFDVATERYVAGVRTGAPANGVRFILYAVSTLTRRPVTPLVETGYVDLTRTVSQTTATARVEAYSVGTAPVKVLDYSAIVGGTVVSPSLLVSGFAKNAGDSLIFTLASQFSLAGQSLGVDWQTAVPNRGLTSRLQQTLTGGETGSLVIEALITSTHGRVAIAGTLTEQSGGVLTVSVNSLSFATLEFSGLDDVPPVIVGANGQQLSAEQQQTLRRIIEWFGDAFDLFEDLMEPARRLLDIAF